MLDLTDWQNKKYVTRDGRPVRILCIDAPNSWSVVYLVGDNVHRAREDGQYSFSPAENSLDILNAKTSHECWFFVARENKGYWTAGPYETEALMQQGISNLLPVNVVHTFKQEWEE